MNNKQSITDLLAQKRTILAAERTYSAWIRTGLAALAGGLGVIRFFEFKTPINRILAHVTGQLLILLGMFLFVFAFLHYRTLMQELSQSYRVSVALWQLALITCILFVAGFLLFLISVH